MTTALDLLTKHDLGMDFPAEAYAYVGDSTNPDTWELRLWETPEVKVTAAQVQRAVAALSGNFLGNKLNGVPADALPTVKSKVLGAWLATHTDCPDMAPGVLRATQDADIVMAGGVSAGRPPLEQDSQGNYIVRGLPIFKVGPFVPGVGKPANFSSDDLRAMVDNFHALRDSGVFVDVPGRNDHTRTIKDVVGYVNNLYTDGVKLYADFQFTSRDAAQLYANGTYRARSIEIGPYEANDRTPFYPVCRGFAFVDIPAVEGLNADSPNNTENEPQETPVKITIAGKEYTDVAAAQAAVQQLETAQVTQVPTFVCAGAEVTDPTKVQSHIAALEGFQTTAVAAAREDFVQSLVDSKRLLATKRDDAVEFATGLTPEMFEAYKAQWDGVATNSAFEKHAGAGNGDDTNRNGGTDERTERIAILQDQVRYHKIAGMSDERLATLDCSKELATLTGKAA